jgi:hypothetical protein
MAVPRDILNLKLASDPSFAAHFYRALGVFLATRLRRTMEFMGYSPDGSSFQEDAADEIDPELLDSVSLAARRFEVLVERFRNRQAL